MARGLLRKKNTSRQAAQGGAETSPFSLDIEIDEREGSLRVYDPRAFRAGRHAFCRRMLEAAAGRPGCRKAEIDFDSSSCRLEFDRGSATSRTMADSFRAAVEDAIANQRVAARPRWWRQAPGWSTLTAYRSADGVSLWETVEARPGRISLRHPAFSGDRRRTAHLTDGLSALDGVERCRVSSWSRTLTVDYRPEGPIADRLVDSFERALQDGQSAAVTSHELARPEEGGAIEVAGGRRRLQYLALAGGCFAMTLVGLIVPGIPTVPFLLATSYYLARSSPGLNDRLRRTAVFGPILDEWERHHGLSGSSKVKLMGLTAAIVVVSIALTSLTPVILVVILILASLSTYGIARLPSAPSSMNDEHPTRPARLALAST